MFSPSISGQREQKLSLAKGTKGQAEFTHTEESCVSRDQFLPADTAAALLLDNTMHVHTLLEVLGSPTVNKLFLLLSFAQTYSLGGKMNIINYIYSLEYIKFQGIFLGNYCLT